MQHELRPITPDEFIAFSKSAAFVFGETATEEELDRQRPLFEFDRSTGIFDGNKIVGTAGILSFELTLPGLVTTPAAGVSYVTVAPTHRRKGILTAMMRRQLSDIRERREAVAILYASESIIYGRYGYGMSTYSATYQIDPKFATMAHGHDAGGQIRLLDKDEARTVLPVVFDRVRRCGPGEISRSDAWWDYWMADWENWRGGMSARVYAAYESPSGQIDGYATYRVQSTWDDGFPNGKLVMGPLAAATPQAREALWRFCLGIDLIRSVEARGTTVEEPLRYMLADPRRLRLTGLSDGLWTRIVDVPRALQARRYAATDTLVIEIADGFVPENAGRYVLDGGPEGATCRRSRAKADLVMNIQELGATYLGGTPFSALAQAGRIREETAGALRRADAMFRSEPTPLCSTGF